MCFLGRKSEFLAVSLSDKLLVFDSHRGNVLFTYSATRDFVTKIFPSKDSLVVFYEVHGSSQRTWSRLSLITIISHFEVKAV